MYVSERGAPQPSAYTATCAHRATCLDIRRQAGQGGSLVVQFSRQQSIPLAHTAVMYMGLIESSTTMHRIV